MLKLEKKLLKLIKNDQKIPTKGKVKGAKAMGTRVSPAQATNGVSVRAEVNRIFNRGSITPAEYDRIAAIVSANPSRENKHYLGQLRGMIKGRQIRWASRSKLPSEIIGSTI